MKVRPVVVSVSEFKNTGNLINKKACSLNEAINEYYICLNKISEEAVISGEVKDALDSYIEFVRQLINVTDVLGQKYESFCRQYIKDIDETSGVLYKGAAASFLRDFTQNKYNELIDVVTDTFYSFDSALDGMQDKAVGFLMDKFGCWDISDADANIKKCQKRLLDYNDYSAGKIKSIFTNIDNRDADYSAYFKTLTDGFLSVKNVLNEMAIIISPNSGLFTTENIKTRLSPLFNMLNKELDECVEVGPPGMEITIEEIMKFTADELNIHFWDVHENAVKDWLNELKSNPSKYLGDAFYFAEYFKNNLKYMFSVPETVPTEETYNYVVLKQYFAELITDSIETDLQPEAESVRKANEIVDSILEGKKISVEDEKYGKLAKLLFKEFDNSGEKVGQTANVVKIVSSILANTIEHENVMKSVIGSFTEGSLAAIAADELMFEYENKILGAVKNVIDYGIAELVEKCIDGGIDLVKEVSNKVINEGVSSFISAFKGGFDAADELYGFSNAGKAYMDVLVLSDLNAEIEKSYRDNFNAVLNGDTSEESLRNLERSFNVLKNLYAKEYSLMATYEGALGSYDKKEYYEYLAESMTNTYIDSGFNGFISYEQYKEMYG